MKNRILKILTIMIIIIPMCANAKRGCCSHHGGVAGCSETGRQICNDGTLSPSCTCTPTYIYGCTDSNAKNYNENANKNDGSCVYYTYGCTDKESINYNEKAEKDDGSCISAVYGCMDVNAKNYDSKANKDDGQCIYYIYGCMDQTAINYNKEANTSDESCEYSKDEIENSNLVSNQINTDLNKDATSDSDGNPIIGVGTLGIVGYFIYNKIKRK